MNGMCHRGWISKQRSGISAFAIVATLFAVGCVAALAGFTAIRASGSSEETLVLHTVEQGAFLHEVVERGEIESSRNVEIRCEVKGRTGAEGTSILEIVEEGTRVAEGDFICRLDSSLLEQDLVEQQILCNSSKSLMITARNLYETAVMAKTEYLEGAFEQEEQTFESEVFVAEENLRRAQQYLLYSQRLAAKGYVTDLQLEGDRFAVEKATNELEAAKTKLRVLREYTKPKMLKDLDAAIQSAEAQWRSEESSHNLELAKQSDIEAQIEKCSIVAPQSGQVVYANQPSSRSQSEFIVEQGAIVRERQTIVRLPDPSAMQVKANISESRITLVKVGMSVAIRLDAFGDESLGGEVIKVNEYPEPSSWFSSQVKQYGTLIQIINPPRQIRPGLTAEVRILIDEKQDVIAIPVQAVHQHGQRFFAFARNNDAWQLRQVELGPTNDKTVVINSGLEVGERISLAPRTILEDVELPELTEEEKKANAKQANTKKPGGKKPGEPYRDGARGPGSDKPGGRPAGKPAGSGPSSKAT